MHNKINLSAEGYNAIAPHYDQWKWQKIWAALEQPLIHNMLYADQKCFALNILDVGAGTGRNLDYIITHFRAATCHRLDISEGMLAIARQKLSTKTGLELGDAKRLRTMKSSSFSHTLLCRIGSHIENIWQPVAEATRVTLPNGKIFISDVHSDHNYQHTHCHLADRTVTIETYKHPMEKWEYMGRNLGLRLLFSRVIRGHDVESIRHIERPTSILRPESSVGMVMIFQKI